MQGREAQEHDNLGHRQDPPVAPGDIRPEEGAFPVVINADDQACIFDPNLGMESPSEIAHGNSDSEEVPDHDLDVDEAGLSNLPFPLPRETCLHIFSFLNTQHLQQTALVSRQSHALSAETRERQFLKKHSKSHWWKFLVALADNVPGEGENKFVEVLILGMGPHVRFPERWRENNATLSAYITRRMAWFPDKIQHLGFGVSGYEDIQKKAQSLLSLMCEDNDRTQFNACTRLRDCFELVNDTRKITAFQHYDDLDRFFSCLILFEFMKGEQANNRWFFLIRSPFSRGLTGAGLIALESQFQGLFPTLVREAIRLFQIEEKQEADSERLRAIEKLLGRLTEADILRYIDTAEEYLGHPFPIPLQRQIFVEILESNYVLMVNKLTWSIFERIESPSGKSKFFSNLIVVPYVLQSHLLLEKIGQDVCARLVNLVAVTEIANVINDHPLFHLFCTPDIMKHIMAQKVSTYLAAKVFLSNKTLLDKLNEDDIVTFSQKISGDGFGFVLDSQAFQERLRADSDNNILMRLIHTENPICNLDKIIAQKHEVSSMLSPEQVIKIFQVKGRFYDAELIQNNQLMSKFLPKQLGSLICVVSPKNALYLLTEHGDRLETSQYMLLEQHYKNCVNDRPDYVLFRKLHEQHKRDIPIKLQEYREQDLQRIRRRSETEAVTNARHQPNSTPKPLSDQEKRAFEQSQWVYYIVQMLWVAVGIFGILLVLSGLGAAGGISLLASATDCLFASILVNTPLAAFITGGLLFFVSYFAWGITESDRIDSIIAYNSRQLGEDPQRSPGGFSFKSASNFPHQSRQSTLESDYGSVSKDRTAQGEKVDLTAEERFEHTLK